MEKVVSSESLFNNPLETGVRATVILNATFPKVLDLAALVLLDHLVVHTGDIDGPESLHPNLPHRSGELLVRRQVIEKGLSLMRRLGLIAAVPDKSGIYYQATDEAYPFVDLLRTSYSIRLKERADWLADFIADFDQDDIHQLVTEKLGRWNIEFQEKNYPANNHL
jgi:hypothetical protein